MEPSCLAVFKNELVSMLPHDDDAKRLAQNAFHFAEFFEKEGIQLPRMPGREAVMWGHCHHKATGGMKPEKKLLEESMGLKVSEATGGCCGLAGSWGFEEGHYELSMKCGEVGLFPAARQAPTDALIIANGFSCKTQLEQSGIQREALHTAEVMKLARELGPGGAPGPYPERMRAKPPKPSLLIRVGRTAAVIGLALVATRSMARALP